MKWYLAHFFFLNFGTGGYSGKHAQTYVAHVWQDLAMISHENFFDVEVVTMRTDVFNGTLSSVITSIVKNKLFFGQHCK